MKNENETVLKTNEGRVKTDNELIAEFMGETVYASRSEMNSVPIKELKPYYLLDQLEYDTSWDWLMPVVEKIEKTCGASVEMRQQYCGIIHHLSKWQTSYTWGTKIGSTYKAVVSFIKWYSPRVGRWEEWGLVFKTEHEKKI